MVRSVADAKAERGNDRPQCHRLLPRRRRGNSAIRLELRPPSPWFSASSSPRSSFSRSVNLAKVAASLAQERRRDDPDTAPILKATSRRIKASRRLRLPPRNGKQRVPKSPGGRHGN